MKLSLVKGTTSKLVAVFIQDSSSTTGAGLTGLAFGTSGLTAYYYREGAGSAVAITLATMTLGTWATGGFIVADGTNMPGVYQIGIPNAALASGASSVMVMLKGAANMAPLVLEIELTATDNQTATISSATIASAVWDTVLASHLTAGSTGNALNAAGSAGDPWATALPGAYGAGSAGKIIGDNINATVSSRATQTSVDTIAGYVDTEVAAIKAKTDLIPASPAAVSDIPTATQNADALLNRDMSAVSDTNARSPLNALRAIRNKVSRSGATITVKKENDSTDAWTAAITTDATVDPITVVDPA